VTFYADLHIHSKYSRATSRDCDLQRIAFWARKKGIAVVATGDFTHPAWFAEIREKLLPAEPGLYRLRPELERTVDRWSGGPGEPVRFMLEVEISTIYKRDGRTRKVHHLIYVPGMDQAARLGAELERIGNIHSDGRPILGLDSRHLLGLVLDCGSGSYLVPAHIWTPWFAVLGSKSGFDSVEECYGELTEEIFALETGLSSDPPMNWRLSPLDRYRLVSNSDAHSPPKLGRECCVFDTPLDFFAMRRALQTGEGYRGTVEFFPEEGKYHYDGHRKCGVCLAPEETRRHNGLCPVCGKPVTLGVMHRVVELADRAEDAVPPVERQAFRSLIPLDEVLAEISGVGPQSKSVQREMHALLARLGPELFILEQAPVEDIRRAGSSLLAEAVRRMRCGEVIRVAGFDGQYGTIRLFDPGELRRGSGGWLFDVAPESLRADGGRGETRVAETGKPYVAERKAAKGPLPAARAGEAEGRPSRTSPGTATGSRPAIEATGEAAEPRAGGASIPAGVLDQLDPGQRMAAGIARGPLLIVAGPGTGKTRTLTHRIAHLIHCHGAHPQQCLAITFTRRAAGEMVERLRGLLPEVAHEIPVMTFHGLGLSILQEHGDRLGLAQPLRVAGRRECREVLQAAMGLLPRQAEQLMARISRHKRQRAASGDAETVAAYAAYDALLRQRRWVDFDDLVVLSVRLLEENPDLLEHYRARYRWISVDEYQDVDDGQYRLIRLLAPPDGDLCVIGDPDQAIYGFRGSDLSYFQRFRQDYPSARVVTLGRNYRSTQWIVTAALQLIAPASLVGRRAMETVLEGLERVEIHQCPTDRAEAEFVVHRIEQMLGGSTFFSMDSGRAQGTEAEGLSFADFAVLYRTEAQADLLVEALARSGMPFQRRSHEPLADQPAVRELMQAMADRPEPLSVPERLAAAVQEVGESAELATSLPALQSLARRYANDFARFLSELALGVDVDLWDPRADRVSLLTLHAAKGLEFPVVFITGCEDGILPLYWGSPKEADWAEERRLLFVGMTRAGARLVLTYASKRRWRGSVRRQEMSPFLRDIQEQLLVRHQHRARRKRATQAQETLFEL